MAFIHKHKGLLLENILIKIITIEPLSQPLTSQQSPLPIFQPPTFPIFISIAQQAYLCIICRTIISTLHLFKIC